MKSEIIDKIEQLSESYFSEVNAIREHLHENPELSFQEFNTMKYVSDRLTEWGIEHQTGIADTGIVAFIRGKFDDKTEHVVLRADLDALPILEQNDVPYKSKVDGVMHACGHDVHTSVLLGTAKILKQLENELSFPVQLIFQPGEEKAPGGASLMIAAGALKMNPVKAIYGLHVFPEMNAGKVGFREGLYMASCDELHIKITGKGGHAALPENCIDPISAGAKIVSSLSKNIKDKCDPSVPCVISIGHFEAIGATNVIPETAILKGTFRTMNEEWRMKALDLMDVQLSEIAKETGTKIEFEIVKGYPFLENDSKTTSELRCKAQEILGNENVENLALRMTAEDFSFYTQLVPACFFRLGVRNEAKGIVYGVHHPKFDVDKNALKTGMQIMASTAF
jgi:amidohydrolase|tara:strand:- start:4894 stop:6078 length:1185 start_codon:yes stop_codon:yes gene_type:complete